MSIEVEPILFDIFPDRRFTLHVAFHSESKDVSIRETEHRGARSFRVFEVKRGIDGRTSFSIVFFESPVDIPPCSIRYDYHILVEMPPFRTQLGGTRLSCWCRPLAVVSVTYTRRTVKTRGSQVPFRCVRDKKPSPKIVINPILRQIDASRGSKIAVIRHCNTSCWNEFRITRRAYKYYL